MRKEVSAPFGSGYFVILDWDWYYGKIPRKHKDFRYPLRTRYFEGRQSTLDAIEFLRWIDPEQAYANSPRWHELGRAERAALAELEDEL